MRIRPNSAILSGLVLWAACGLFNQTLHAQSPSAQTWNLPQGTAVKDTGPRTYRFNVDYNMANTKGEVQFRQHLTGEYTRGLADGEVMWRNVSQADAAGPSAPFGAAQRREFMEGFRYRDDLGNTMKPEFFKGFPATAVFERNLVWDTRMLEMFGQNLQLKTGIGELCQT